MLDHMTFRVTDIARTKAFYTAALAPLGYSLCFEGNYGSNMLGYAYPAPSEPDGKKADVWFIDGPSPYGGPPATTGSSIGWSPRLSAMRASCTLIATRSSDRRLRPPAWPTPSRMAGSTSRTARSSSRRDASNAVGSSLATTRYPPMRRSCSMRTASHDGLMLSPPNGSKPVNRMWGSLLMVDAQRNTSSHMMTKVATKMAMALAYCARITP